MQGDGTHSNLFYNQILLLVQNEKEKKRISTTFSNGTCG